MYDMPIDANIGPYEHRPAECNEHDRRSAEVACKVASLIEAHLPGFVVAHIGSTSVPGCAGKGIVDLMLVYQDGQLARARDLLDVLGFQHQTTRDPFPEDLPMRMGSLIHDGTAFNLHVHVIAASSPEAQELRDFRDRLRADPTFMAACVADKREILADGCTDPIDYCYHKGEFILAVRERGHGQAWADRDSRRSARAHHRRVGEAEMQGQARWGLRRDC
jgi:GrpB-like predicted nucleotidyltransferase (UPF0157 family)